MSMFLRHFFLVLLIAASGISYAQKKDTLVVRKVTLIQKEYTLAQKNPTIGTKLVRSPSDTLKFRIDCSRRSSYKKAPILIRSSSGKDVFLVDGFPSIQSKDPKQWIDSIKVHKSSDKEILKYGDRWESGIILLVIKEKYFSDVLNSIVVEKRIKVRDNPSKK